MELSDPLVGIKEKKAVEGYDLCWNLCLIIDPFSVFHHLPAKPLIISLSDKEEELTPY